MMYRVQFYDRKLGWRNWTKQPESLEDAEETLADAAAFFSWKQFRIVDAKPTFWQRVWEAIRTLLVPEQGNED